MRPVYYRLKRSVSVIRTGAFILVVLLGLMKWIIAPQAKALHAVEVFEPTLEQIQDRQVTLRESIGRQQRLLSDLYEDFNDLVHRFYTIDQVYGFDTRLSAIARETSCQINAMEVQGDGDVVTLSEGSNQMAIERVTVKLFVHGRYKAIISFIRRLQDPRQMMVISDLVLQHAEGESNDAHTLQCAMNVTFFIVLNDRQDVCPEDGQHRFFDQIIGPGVCLWELRDEFKSQEP